MPRPRCPRMRRGRGGVIAGRRPRPRSPRLIGVVEGSLRTAHTRAETGVVEGSLRTQATPSMSQAETGSWRGHCGRRTGGLIGVVEGSLRTAHVSDVETAAVASRLPLRCVAGRSFSGRWGGWGGGSDKGRIDTEHKDALYRPLIGCFSGPLIWAKGSPCRAGYPLSVPGPGGLVFLAGLSGPVADTDALLCCSLNQ